MNDSVQKSTLYEKYCKATAVVYKFLLAVCVLCLGIEIVSVFIMVTGRFLFNTVPLWCDQMSLIALVWMALISVSLAFYDGSHMRVELLDMFAPKVFIDILKYLSNILITAVSVAMIFQGYKLFDLTKNYTLSGFRVSEGLYYIPLMICGLGSVYMNIFCMIRRMKGDEPK